MSPTCTSIAPGFDERHVIWHHPNDRAALSRAAGPGLAPGAAVTANAIGVADASVAMTVSRAATHVAL